MADRTIVLAQNKRHAVRGVTVVNPQEFSAYQEDDDDLTYIVDMSSYLDGATISSVTRTANGPTVSNTSNTTTRITQRLKGFGSVDFKVTTSSGDVEEFRINIEPRAGSAFFLTATASVPQNTAQFFATETDAASTSPAATVGFIWTSGRTAPGDGYGGLYALVSAAPSSAPYFTTSNGRIYERVTWGRAPALSGGWFTSTDALIWRLSDRLFVGEAAIKWAATAAGVPDAGTSWLSNNADGPAFLGVGAALLVTTPEDTSSGGRYAVVGAAKLSASTNSSGIGTAGAVINNKAGASGWALYGDVVHNSTGISHGLEVACKNVSTDLTATPYTDNNGVYGVWCQGGGDNAYGPAAANPSNSAFVVVKGAHTWNSGLLFKDDALTGTDGTSGSTGTGVAVMLARRHAIRWYEPTNFSTAAEIISSVTATANKVGITFADLEVRFIAPNDAVMGAVTASGTVANYLSLTGRPAGSAARLDAAGTDTNIDIWLNPKGTGVARFGTHSALGAEVLSGYITIKDSGGTTRKIAVIS